MYLLTHWSMDPNCWQFVPTGHFWLIHYVPCWNVNCAVSPSSHRFWPSSVIPGLHIHAYLLICEFWVIDQVLSLRLFLKLIVLLYQVFLIFFANDVFWITYSSLLSMQEYGLDISLFWIIMHLLLHCPQIDLFMVW